MIGSNPAVLKMKMQMNRANCFLVPVFQSAIPFQIISRIIRKTNKAIVPFANIGAAVAVSSGVMEIWL